MPIKKNPAKANIGPKKQVKATFAECTAENPLKCKYHGLKAFDNLISQCLAKNGMTAAFVTDKVGDGYELRFSPDTIFGKAVPDISYALHEKGLHFKYKGIHPETGAAVYKAQENDNGIAYETPANEAELEDADTLSSSKAPENNTVSKSTVTKKDPFAELENMDVDALIAENELDADLMDNFDDLEGVTAEATEDLEAELLGNSDYDDVLSVLSDGEHTDTELTDEDIKNLVAIKGITEKDFNQNPDLIDVYKAIITTGKNPNGQELTNGQKTWWNDLIAKATSANGDELPALKVLKATMKGIGETQESKAPVVGDTTNLSAEMVTCQKKWANLYDTAVNEKKLEGTQYWAEKIAPIVEAYNEGISAKDVVKAFDAVYDLKNAVKDAPNNAAQEEAPGQPFTDEEFKEALQKYYEKTGYNTPTEVAIEMWKQAALSGTTNGEPLSEHNQKLLSELAKTAGAKSSVGKAIKETLAKLKPGKYVKEPKKGAKEALAEALSGNVVAIPSEGMLSPLEHDESKFPQITQDELDEAIKKGKKLGGHGGLGTRLVEIDGKSYVCKAATGTGASVIRNGYNADMAYRAGGIYAPDAKLYEFVDGKIYKLSEFIPGKRLIDVWKDADETTREGIRKELLKGYPLDALFSNYDVLGTSPEDSITCTIQGADGKPQKTHVAFNNIMIGDDGHAYRVDNDGSFAMTGTGGIKSSSGGGYIAKVASEKWDNWEDRQWIDDFRTLRRNEKNLGIFDRYSTADIFLSAGNINLNAAVGTLPQGLQKALAKPLFEMKQMTMRALSARLGGIKNDVMLSAALDASYEASKQGFRELCIGEISFSSGGIGAKKSDKAELPPYPVAKPAPPEDPSKKFAAGAMLSNADYKGTKVSEIILDAAKTINYHAGFVMTDAQGNKLGGGKALPTPDFSPNSNKIAAFKRIDREKLVELAKTSDSAKAVLNYYDSVATSIDNGYKLPVQEVKQTVINESLPSGFKTKAEVEFETNKEKVMSQYHVDLKEYNDVTLPEYLKGKKEWEDNEKAKLRAGGHGLEGNFYDIANEFMESAYNTDGIAQHNGESIDFIELGKYQNKYGGNVSGATTHNDSWTPASSHLKVLDLLMSGWALEDIVKISNDDPLVNNGHHSGKTAKNWFIDEAKKMLSAPEQTRREMIAYAVFKGMQVVKLENETADVSLSTGGKVSWIDHGCHTVALIRKESFSNANDNTIAPVVQKGGNVSCGFQSNGAIGMYPYAYDVPLWNISYTYSDANHKGSKVDAYQGSEHEWVANLVGLTPFRVNSSINASQNVNLSRNNSTLKKERDKRVSRLAQFFTTMADLKSMVKKSIKGH